MKTSGIEVLKLIGRIARLFLTALEKKRNLKSTKTDWQLMKKNRIG